MSQVSRRHCNFHAQISLAAILVLILLVVVLFLILLFLIPVVVLILITIFHEKNPPLIRFAVFRRGSMPCMGLFILRLKNQSRQPAEHDGRGDAPGCGHKTAGEYP